MWTLQEAVIAPHNRVFILANEYLIRLVVLSARGLSKTFEKLFSLKLALLSPVLHQFAPTKIAELLQWGRERQCSDARDKIFALYWIISRVITNERSKFPEPDYDKSISQVYTETTAWTIVYQEDLRILYLTPLSSSEYRQSSPSADLPSWVPDFGRLSTLRRLDSASPIHQSAFAASCKVTPRSEFLSHQQQMRVSGIVHDVVRDVSDELPSWESWDQNYETWAHDAYNVLLGWFLKLDHSDSQLPEKLCRTLLQSHRPEDLEWRSPGMQLWFFGIQAAVAGKYWVSTVQEVQK